MCLKMKIDKKEIRALIHSFYYAFRGLWYCIKNERNMRIHITAAVLVSLFAVIYGLTRTQFAILSLTFGLVMMCELLNTAIEARVDLSTDAYDHIARIAKDVAAGAVLVCAFAALAVAAALFGDWGKLQRAVCLIVAEPYLWITALVLLGLGALFIFCGVPKKTPKEQVKVYHANAHKPVFQNDSDEVKIYHPKQRGKHD